MTAVGIALLAVAAVLVWDMDRRIMRRFGQIELDVDQAYARIVHRHGMTAEQIAVELGRPAHQVRDWLAAPAPDRGTT